MLDYGTVGDPVVRNKEGPSPPCTVVLVTAMEEVAMEEQGITRLHLNMLQGQHLHVHTLAASVLIDKSRLKVIGTFLMCSTLSISAPVCPPTRL